MENNTPATADNTNESPQVTPRYFSEIAVYVFSILGGPLFGSILMAINLKNTPGKKGVGAVLAFGISLTVLLMIISSLAPEGNTSTLGIAFGIGSGLLIRKFFWVKYIGESAVYEKRSVLIPTIILIALLALVVWSFVLKATAI